MANIWRFPSLVAEYGGLTFILPYFLFVILIASSGVIGEFALGRWGGAGPVGSFEKAMGSSGHDERLGRTIGIVPVIGALCLAIGYSVVMAWIFRYTFMAFDGTLTGMGNDMGAIVGLFSSVAPEASTLGEAVSMMLSEGIFRIGSSEWVVIAVAVTAIIMVLGISRGIERCYKIIMPALFILLILLAVYVFTLPGASDGYAYIFSLDPKGLTDPLVWVFAFGQAFFSLSVAGNGSVIYGSYLGKGENIPRSAVQVAIFDTFAAMLAMMVIIPAMASTGTVIDSGGPGLMFIYMVDVFNTMPGAYVVTAIFYVAVLFAGISSLINLYETPVAFLQERYGIKRIGSVAIMASIGIIVAILIQPWVSQWMDIVSIYICPLGAFLAGLMFFHIIQRHVALEAVNQGNDGRPLGNRFHIFGRWVYVPMCIIALVMGIILGGIG